MASHLNCFRCVKMDQYRVESDFALSRMLFFGISSIGLFVIALYFIFVMYVRDAFEILPSFTALAFLFLSAWFFRKVVSSDKLLIENDVLNVLSFWGKLKRRIPLSEIGAFGEVERNMGISRKELTLFAIPDKYVISSSIYKNYGFIKAVLVADKPDYSSSLDRTPARAKKKLGRSLTILGSLIMFVAFAYLFVNKPPEIPPNDLTFYAVTLANDLSFSERSGSKVPNSLFPMMEFVQYPGYKFELENRELNFLSLSLVPEVSKGTTVEIGLLKKEREKMVFMSGNETIKVAKIHGIKLGGKELRSADFKEQEPDIERQWMVGVILLSGLVFFLFGIFQWGETKYFVRTNSIKDS